MFLSFPLSPIANNYNSQSPLWLVIFLSPHWHVEEEEEKKPHLIFPVMTQVWWSEHSTVARKRKAAGCTFVCLSTSRRAPNSARQRACSAVRCTTFMHKSCGHLRHTLTRRPVQAWVGAYARARVRNVCPDHKRATGWMTMNFTQETSHRTLGGDGGKRRPASPSKR